MNDFMNVCVNGAVQWIGNSSVVNSSVLHPGYVPGIGSRSIITVTRIRSLLKMIKDKLMFICMFDSNSGNCFTAYASATIRSHPAMLP